MAFQPITSGWPTKHPQSPIRIARVIWRNGKITVGFARGTIRLFRPDHGEAGIKAITLESSPLSQTQHTAASDDVDSQPTYLSNPLRRRRLPCWKSSAG